MNKIELLAPVGNKDSLIAAIKAGADAVYLSGKTFGARSYADNFSNEELEQAINYAHLNYVKVYVTINTLIFDDEFERLNEFLNFLVKIKVDAVIVQDLGVIKLIKTTYPTLEIHASTQMNIFNEEGAKNLLKMGVKRVVVARETTLADLKAIINTGIEVEVFCHGALCFSSSGNCLASSFIGKRSGNRGKCAQPCRKSYSLMEDGKIVESNKSFLSTKDLMTIDYLGELKQIGITSLKIEGRMKSPDYVYTVTKNYRKHLDQTIDLTKEELNDLLVVFNRKFTKGYLFAADNCDITNLDSVNHQGIPIGKIVNRTPKWIEIKLTESLSIHDGLRIVTKSELGLLVTCMYVNGNIVKQAFPNQVVRINILNQVSIGDRVLKTVSNKLHQAVLQGLKNQNKKIGLNLTIDIYQNEPLKLSCKWNEGSPINLIGNTLIAGDHILSNERVKEQLSKLSNTIYYIDNLVINTDGKAFLPVSVLNDLRRRLIEKLNEQLLSQNIDDSLQYELIHQYNDLDKSIEIECVCHNEEQTKVCEDLGITTIYNLGSAYSGRIISDHKLMIHNLGQLNQSVQVLSPYFNLVNRYALEAVRNFGIKKCYLSLEMDLNHLKQLNLTNIDLEVGVCCYGKVDMMVSKHCIVGKYQGYENKKCGACLKHQYHLIDELGNKYPLLLEKNNDCSMRILNYQSLNLVNYLTELKTSGISKYLLVFTDESKEQVETIIKLYQDGLNGKKINQKFYTGFIEHPVI